MILNNIWILRSVELLSTFLLSIFAIPWHWFCSTRVADIQWQMRVAPLRDEQFAIWGIIKQYSSIILWRVSLILYAVPIGQPTPSPCFRNIARDDNCMLTFQYWWFYGTEWNCTKRKKSDRGKSSWSQFCTYVARIWCPSLRCISKNLHNLGAVIDELIGVNTYRCGWASWSSTLRKW